MAVAEACCSFLRVDDLREFVAIVDSIRGIGESSYDGSNG
jgi:hypothetical protein